MKYVKILHNNSDVWASAEGNTLRLLTKPPFTDIEYSGETCSPDSAVLLPPCEATKIVAVGKNYYDHIKEIHSDSEVPKNPILFIKPSTSLLAHNGVIVRPACASRVDHEAELAFVIKKRLQK